MTATILDVGIFVLIALSALIGLIRGFVKESLSLATWVAAFGLSALYWQVLATKLPFGIESQVVRLGIAFAIIFFGVLLVGAVINHWLSSLVAGSIFGKLDHVLGLVLGIVRGGLIVAILVLLIMSVTASAKQAWWQDSLLMPPFEHMAKDVLMPWVEQMADTVKAMFSGQSGFLERPAADAVPPAQ